MQICLTRVSGFIFKNISQEKSPAFYKTVLSWITSQRKSLPRYNLLIDVLTEEEKDACIRQHKSDHIFYTGILHEEKRYSEILQFIRKHMDSWHLNKMIVTIMDPYPEECFEIFKKKALQTVEKERGRSVYKRIVEWLLLAQKIKKWMSVPPN